MSKTPAKVKQTLDENGFEVRERQEFDITETFGIELRQVEDSNGKPVVDKKGNPVRKRHTVLGFAKPGPETPAIDSAYVFPKEETKILLLGILPPAPLSTPGRPCLPAGGRGSSA